MRSRRAQSMSKCQELPSGYSEGKLTGRQERIVALVAAGAHDHKIAARVGLTLGTEKNYVCQIFDRLGVWNRVELALWFEKRRAEILGLSPQERDRAE